MFSRTKQLSRGKTRKNQYLYDLYGRNSTFISISDIVKVNEKGNGLYQGKQDGYIELLINKKDIVEISEKDIITKKYWWIYKG